MKEAAKHRWTRTAGLVLCLLVFARVSCDSNSSEDDGNNGPRIWTRKTNMPTARFWHACSVVDGKIYVIGGVAAEGPAFSKVEMYDPATDTWTAKRNMPTPRVNLMTGVVDGKIYAFGGGQSFEIGVAGEQVLTVEIYDPVTDTWTSKTDMPTDRGAASASVVDGIIYIMGGVAPPGVMLDVVEAYDPATDTWTTKRSMPHPQHSLATCEVDRKIYAIGGGREYAKTVAEYDPAMDTWVKKADMPFSNGYFGAAVVDGQIYTMGGGTQIVFGRSAVMAYDPVADTWTEKTAMPTARFGLCAGVVNGKIYAIGGGRDWPPTPLNTVEVYDPGLGR